MPQGLRWYSVGKDLEFRERLFRERDHSAAAVQSGGPQKEIINRIWIISSDRRRRETF